MGKSQCKVFVSEGRERGVHLSGKILPVVRGGVKRGRGGRRMYSRSMEKEE
jgi:hypothetical protein